MNQSDISIDNSPTVCKILEISLHREGQDILAVVEAQVGPASLPAPSL